MESFYIFRLPSVALGQLLKHYNPFELLDLSQCSKKLSKQIRLGGTQHFKLSIDFRFNRVTIKDRCFIEIREKSREEMEEHTIIGYRNYENYTIPIAFDKRYSKEVYMFWDDLFIGVKTIGFHLSNLFGCPINGFHWGGDQFENLGDFNSTIHQIIDKQSKIEDLDISVEGLGEDEFKRILDKLTVTRELSINLKLSPAFQYQFSPEPRMLMICNSIWFTLDNLLATNCERIVLYGSSLTNQDVDLYLQKWKAGDYPKLEKFIIASCNFNNQSPIFGMFPPIMDKANPRKESRPIDYFALYGGVDIKRDDGMKAMIKMDKEKFELDVMFKLTLVV